MGLKGSRDFGPFHIKPKAHTKEEEVSEDEWRESRLPEYTAEDNPFLGRPKSQKGKVSRRPRQSPWESQRRFQIQWASHRSMVEKQPTTNTLTPLMWMWPLDRAIGATAAHRAPERVADRTCTQVWAWMTNKCRRRMNGGEGYIATEISQKRRRKERRKKGSWEARGAGSSHPRTRSPFSLGCRAVWFYVLSSYLIIARSQTSRRPIRAQLLDPLSTNSL